MDRNTVIGLFLLGLVLTVFSIYNQPSQAEIDAENQKIEQADKIKEVDEKKQKDTAEKNKKTEQAEKVKEVDEKKQKVTADKNEKNQIKKPI